MSEKEEIKEKKKKKRKIKPTDILFWALIVLLIIPQTRSFFLGGISKIRTAIFTPGLKASDGPILDATTWQWSLTELNGEQVQLADFQNEVILVNSWATWCPPCRAEMPSLQKLFEGYGDKIAMILVTQEEPGVVKEYIGKKSYTFPVYLSSSAYPQAFSSRSIPTTYLVNRDGQVVYQRSGAFDWNSVKVRKFLDQLLAE